MNGTFDGTVCGQRPCMFMNEKLLINSESALGVCEEVDSSDSADTFVEVLGTELACSSLCDSELVDLLAGLVD